ncbi:hypothetical protein ACPUVO_15310 [Pseudocolwellia sp. HL-MZ19]|uniref:hypothetical protein n=1 Tax=unclassified Pseudocolwellia TaxID=2848178 RepID=UPI003CF246A8
MAVINCPSCKKKISDKAKTCNHCNMQISGIDQDKLALIKQTNAIKQQQSLMTHSFIAMLLFCGGFLFFYLKDAQPGTIEYIISIASTVLGFILYLVTRVRLLLLKRNK